MNPWGYYGLLFGLMGLLLIASFSLAGFPALPVFSSWMVVLLIILVLVLGLLFVGPLKRRR